jgi:hypothetical protein
MASSRRGISFACHCFLVKKEVTKIAGIANQIDTFQVPSISMLVLLLGATSNEL